MKYLVMSLVVLGLGAQANAADLVYQCDGIGYSKGDSVTLTIVNRSEVKVDNDVARLDTTYRPRGNQGFLRFEYDQSEEGTSEVLVQEKLVEGAMKGLIKVQNRGEGFSSGSYYCNLLLKQN